MLFVCFCIFRIRRDQSLFRPSDDVRITFSGLKSPKRPLTLDYSFRSALCESRGLGRRKNTFGGNLMGEVSTNVPFSTQFLKKFDSDVCFCAHNLTQQNVKDISALISEEYNFNFRLGQNTLISSEQKGFKIGENDLIYNHFTFIIKYQEITKNELYQVISLNGKEESVSYQPKQNNTCVKGGGKMVLAENTTLAYRFTIKFEKSNDPKEEKEPSNEIHNYLLVMVVLNAILLSLVIYIAKTNCWKTSSSPLDDEMDESLWYYLRGDIFRPPHTIVLLCTLTGIGCQGLISLLATSLCSFTSMSDVLSKYFTFLAWFGCVGGFTSMRFFKQIGGFEWRLVFMSSIVAIPSFFFLVFSFRSFIHFLFDSTASPTLGTVGRILLLCVIHFITTSIGMFLGLKLSSDGPPFKVNMIPKQIMIQPFYLDETFIKFIGGSFIFANCFKVVRFVFKNAWLENPISFNLSTFILLVTLLAITSAEVSVLFVYLQARKENYKWWWTAFNVPASVGIVFLVYSFFFYRKESTYESSFSSIALYICNNIAASGIISIACGSVGLISCLVFLWRVYAKYSL